MYTKIHYVQKHYVAAIMVMYYKLIYVTPQLQYIHCMYNVTLAKHSVLTCEFLYKLNIIAVHIFLFRSLISIGSYYCTRLFKSRESAIGLPILKIFMLPIFVLLLLLFSSYYLVHFLFYIHH